MDQAQFPVHARLSTVTDLESVFVDLHVALRIRSWYLQVLPGYLQVLFLLLKHFQSTIKQSQYRTNKQKKNTKTKQQQKRRHIQNFFKILTSL